jgi:hypothetical protein
MGAFDDLIPQLQSAPAVTPAPVEPKPFDDLIPKEKPQDPTFLGTMADTLTAAPKQIYEAGKSALGNLWESEEKSAKANAESPSGVFTDWASKGPEFAEAASAPFAPVTNLVSAGVKAVVQPMASGIASGMTSAAQTVGEPIAKSLNPDAALPSKEEVYGALEPEVETALGLITPGRKVPTNPGNVFTRRGNTALGQALGREPVPPSPPAPPARGPLTLTTGEESGDLPQIQREQSIMRGERGAIAQRATVPFQQQRTAEIEALQNSIADELGPGDQSSPNEAGSVVSGRLGDLEKQRNTALQRQGDALVPKGAINPLEAADTVAQTLRDTAESKIAARGSNATALQADREGIRTSLSPTGQVLASNPQEAADIVSAGVTRAEEQATARRDKAFETFESLPGSFRPQAFTNIANDVRRVLNDPKDPFILNDKTTSNTLSAIDDLDRSLGEPARVAADPDTQSFTPFTPSRVNDVRKKLNAYWRAANNTARATNDYSDVAGMSRVVDAFDDTVSNALKRKRLFDGDGRAIGQAWDDALAAHADLRKTFSPQGKGDTVGPVMSKIIGQREGQAMPANAIEQATTGSGATPVLVGRRLQSIFGPASPEIGAIKQSLFSKAVEPAEGMAPYSPEKIADNLDKLRATELARTHFTPQELSRMRQHAIDLRNSVTAPLARTDVVGRALDNINGVGGQGSTLQELNDTLFGKSGVGDNPLGVKLAQHVKNTYGENSDAFRALQDGQLSKAVQGGSRAAFDHETAADNLDELLNGRGKPMSDVLYSPERQQAIAGYRDALRDYVGKAALPDDPVERAISRITGRDGGLPATDAEVRDMLYSRSVPYDTATRVALAKRLKGVLSPEAWGTVSKGLFRHLIEPGGDLKDWGPGKVSERIKKFLDVDGQAMSNVIWSPQQRSLVRTYGDLMGKLEVPKAGANWSGTTGALLRAVGSKVGMTAATIVGELFSPGIYSAVISPVVGYGVGKLGEMSEARWARKQMPIFADKMQKWQKAVAAAQRTGLPPYKMIAAAAFNEASRVGTQLGIDLRGIVGAAAQEENNSQPGPQDQKRDGGNIKPEGRRHGGKVNDSPRSKPAYHPKVTGARLAPDGYYYLKDPNRPGKYLKVIERGRAAAA